MEEIEVPMEKLHEDIHHAALHGQDMGKAALLSAFLAVFAAISALFAGHYANEAMIEQIKSSDHWAYYQAKGIKLAITELKASSDDADKYKGKIEQYKKDQEEIKAQAEEIQHESQAHLHKHESLAASVTLFQIAIAMTAIAVLTRRKRFLYTSSLLGLAGLLWMIKSFLS